jgi:hypothetical protein
MKKTLLAFTILTGILTGCGSSSNQCCLTDVEKVKSNIPSELGDTETTPTTDANDTTPVAVITQIPNTFTFSCADSYDRDENGESIEECVWHTEGYNSNDEPIKENQGKEGVNTVTIQPCGNAAYAIITLTVTDDEGDTNTTSQRINF